MPDWLQVGIAVSNLASLGVSLAENREGRKRLTMIENPETTLVELLPQKANFLAVGADGTSGPILKIAASEDRWQSVVVDIAKRATAILIVADGAAAVLWEFEHLRSTGDLPHNYSLSFHRGPESRNGEPLQQLCRPWLLFGRFMGRPVLFAPYLGQVKSHAPARTLRLWTTPADFPRVAGSI